MVIMKKQNIVILGVIVAVISMYFLLNRGEGLQSLKNPPLIEHPLASQSEWKTYENTAYHFTVKYPQTGFVRKASEADPTHDEKSTGIEIYTPDGHRVSIKTFDPNRGLGSEKEQIITSGVKFFAETAHQKEISDKNQNFPNKKVGGLKEIIFVNKKAFSYVVVGSSDGYGSDDNNYIFLEHGDIIFTISYPTNDKLPQTIAETFEFTEK